MSESSFSLYGVNVPQHGHVSGFSVPFIVLNMIGAGLSWFMAMAWSNVFQSGLDRYKAEEENKGNTINPVWINFTLALGATVFTVAIMYFMIRGYSLLVPEVVPNKMSPLKTK